MHNGGPGLISEYAIGGTQTVLSAGYTRHKQPVWGLAGGMPGTTNRIEVIRPDGRSDIFAFASGVTLSPGDVVRITTAKGGGWGPPSNGQEPS